MFVQWLFISKIVHEWFDCGEDIYRCMDEQRGEVNGSFVSPNQCELIRETVTLIRCSEHSEWDEQTENEKKIEKTNKDTLGECCPLGINPPATSKDCLQTNKRE